MTTDEAHAQLRAFLTTRRATSARLRRVNAALPRLDEYDAAAAMPVDLRPQVERPTLSRQALKELQRMLCDFVGELDELWERRH
jgi:hypothetical protein